MAVDRKHYINLQGKDYVTFPGLLDLAHQKGLCGVHTELLQFPCAENGETAIVRATCRFRGDGSFIDEWTGIGDASPKNVNRMIATALIRMAETRSIARALRMATNVGETAYEELPGGAGADSGDEAPESPRERVQTNRQESARAAPANAQESACAVCNAPLTAATARASIAAFKEPLCPTHVREKAALASARVPAGTVAG